MLLNPERCEATICSKVWCVSPSAPIQDGEDDLPGRMAGARNATLLEDPKADTMVPQ